MIKKIISVKFASLFFISLALTSCSEDKNGEENYSVEKRDISATEARKFLNAYTVAKAEDKEQLLTSFSKKNKITADESETLTAATLDTYSPEQMAAIIPTTGGAQPGILCTNDQPGGVFYRRVEWMVAENPYGMWRIKSFEDVTHNMSMVLQALHFGTRFEGFTFGVISWQEMNSAGNVQVGECRTRFYQELRGL